MGKNNTKDNWYGETLKYLKNDLYDSHKTKTCLQFLQSSLLHYAICLEIGSGTYNNNYISYEKICDSIPKKFGSRSTIQAILNHGVEEKFFIKKFLETDKRIKTYSFTDEFMNDIEYWINSKAEKINKYKNVA